MASSSVPSYTLRANLTPYQKITTTCIIGGIWGFMSGSRQGAKRTSLQYLAEHAHVLPKTKEQWYFYHKKKNYKVTLGAIRAGLKYSAKMSALCFLYSSLETSLDFIRKENDFINSFGAGIMSGAIVSGIYRLPKQSTRYAIMIGAGVGLMTGSLQDIIRYKKGQRIWYLEWK
ncbi:2875_t:CDS:2 [Funneliformis mosseae]|uniref:2875_t:CDS:1 n=1 Tax=Funneliformis mosseae TaxID=27381 RepID=A0A9N9DBI3_FUNMO|nr:2875_t:CDS:2 [Funneliformis mosseae]